jgi:cell division protein FtsW
MDFKPRTEPRAGRANAPDFLLFLLTVVLVVAGLILVYSASAILAQDRYGSSYHFFLRQLLWVGVGSLGLWVASRVELESLRALAIPGLFLGLFLMALVCVPGIGKTVGGAQRWFGLGPFSFQPSEVMKVALVLYLADSLDRRKGSLAQISGLFPYMVLLGICVVLLERQHDFGTVVLLAVATILMLFLAGLRWSFILAPLGLLLPVLIFLVESNSYRMKRISSFLNPWEDPQGTGFQLIQSLIAVGNGGLFGVGLSNSSQKLFYLPAPHTDFIFAIIAEELGLIGALAVVFLFGALVLRGFKVASSVSTKEGGHFPGLLAAGLTGVLGAQALVNLGVVTGLLPTKGIPLPLISYGGSSMLFTLVSLGLLLNVSRRTKLPSSLPGRAVNV